MIKISDTQGMQAGWSRVFVAIITKHCIVSMILLDDFITIWLASYGVMTITYYVLIFEGTWGSMFKKMKCFEECDVISVDHYSILWHSTNSNNGFVDKWYLKKILV